MPLSHTVSPFKKITSRLSTCFTLIQYSCFIVSKIGLEINVSKDGANYRSSPLTGMIKVMPLPDYY
jgi:hypothetical protein